MPDVEPKTRLDKLVQVRERGEDSALEGLARAQSGLGRATERLAGLRQVARAGAVTAMIDSAACAYAHA